MTSSIVVGLDIGTTSSKAVARLAAASASRPGRPYA
jgi:sugar (pentulose or hexulose) kinase